MVTPSACLRKYGDPQKRNNIVIWEMPVEIVKQIPCLPAKIYCNKDLIIPLANALKSIINKGLTKELKTWDGCFNIRTMRGSQSMSLHSWGIAVDVNAATNQLGKMPTLSAAFVKCFTDAGFDWGGTWIRKDGMHFQLKNI
jgi:hypothetical protein